MAGEWNGPSFIAVTVWESWSWLVQVIVVPTLTVTTAGANAKFWMATVLVATGAAAAGAAAGACPAIPGIPGISGVAWAGCAFAVSPGAVFELCAVSAGGVVFDVVAQPASTPAAVAMVDSRRTALGRTQDQDCRMVYPLSGPTCSGRRRTRPLRVTLLDRGGGYSDGPALVRPPARSNGQATGPGGAKICTVPSAS